MLVFILLGLPLMMALIAIGRTGGKDALIWTGYGVSFLFLFIFIRAVGSFN